ncbi:MAG TPA: polysaccharide deacetylase family protein [bacterium]|nr:polysaccharide deacetylase family protein [bacterium]
MRRTLELLAMIICLATGAARANNPPANPAEPSGCSAYSPDSTFDVRITRVPAWGIVPFESQFALQVTSGTDSLVDAYWDFDGDGMADAEGLESEHVFFDPVAQNVTAQIVTRANGTLTRSVTVEAYSAAMSLTFDDGQVSIYDTAYPLLASKGLVATAYIVPTWIGGLGYLSWQQVTQLQAGGWDIGSHSLTHRDLTKVDSLTLDFELRESKAQLQARGFSAKHFAVPYGVCNWTVINAVKQYYQSCRGWWGSNPPFGQIDPYLLKWDVTASWEPLDYYKDGIDQAIDCGGWYILNNHLVYDDCAGLHNCVATQMLSAIIDYAVSKRVKIMSIDQALASMPSPPPPGPGGHEHVDVSHPGALELAPDRTCVSEFPVSVRFVASGGVGVNLAIYDVEGRVIQTLADLKATDGENGALWDGLTSSGAQVADGCYFCVLRTADNRSLAKKLLVVR